MDRTRLTAGRFLRVPIGLLVVLVCLPLVTNTAANRRSSTPAHLLRDSSKSETWRIYDSSDNHIWNRLYRSLYLRVAHDGREYGSDELDPLLWDTTRHLLGGSAHSEALNCLDEFLDTRAERMISDPLKRALLQRDLWAIFDWTAQRSSTSSKDLRELQYRLAKAMRRLSLTGRQIGTLPATYDAAVAARAFATYYDPSRPEVVFLPPDLFEPGGPWIQLSIERGGMVAPAHINAFSGRSVFQVFISLPQGRKATFAYLRRLSEFPKPWIRNRRNVADVLPNPGLPQFPVGTRLALVRRMVVIDEKGNLTPTSIIESVQVRVHRTIPVEIPAGFDTDRNEARASLDVYEFRLSRAKLFSGDSGGLRAVAPAEKEFPLFQSHGTDLFDIQEAGRESIERQLRPVLGSCSSCHFRPGIHSVLSRTPDITLLRVRDVRRNLIHSSDPAYESNITREWKQTQVSWRLLRELWQMDTAASSSVSDVIK
jgi:hypothetical protein